MSWFTRRANAALAARVPAGGLRRFLSVDPPRRRTAIRQAPLLALDVETTGLDPRRDHLLSAGLVEVHGLQIPLGSAREFLVDQGVEVGQSAVIHQLTDDAISAEGVGLTEALDQIFDALAGRVLLAHHAAIEQDFLRAAVRSVYGIEVTIPAVDTMQLGLRALGEEVRLPGDAARLWRLRARAGLPTYRGHDALTDALACAELYLALAQELGLSTLGDAMRG